MSKKNSGIVSIVLRALLEGRTINRMDYDNRSLHTWISTLRNERYIPIVAKKKNPDRICDYYMLPEEIVRFQNPKLRKEQKTEMRLIVEWERQQRLVKKLLEFLKSLAKYPVLWSYWDELPFKLDEIEGEINALLSKDKGAKQ